MALCVVRTISQLDSKNILAPERYDPRRIGVLSPHMEGKPLSSIVQIVRKMISPGRESVGQFLILDTTHASEGVVTSTKNPVPASEIGSAKKLVEAGDVIISRLRPYLRQVAYVDGGLKELRAYGSIVCSTEFFVLRPNKATESIAFLVPFLLSPPVQEILAASQEGGHHPRFNEATLETLTVPEGLLKVRKRMSADVERAIALYREKEKLFAQLGEEISRIQKS